MSTAEQDVKKTTMAALKPPAKIPVSIAPDQSPGFFSLEAFELMQRVSKMFSESSIVPERYRGQIANCSIALEMANRLKASPLMVMQNLYVVYGSPAWAAKFLIACFNQSGKFTALRYQFEGSVNTDAWGCRAWALELSTQEKLMGPLITIGLAKAEGWYGKKDSKWKTMPEQMLRYRSAAWFINTAAPEISMGLPTSDELGDTFDATQGPDGSFAVPGSTTTVGALRAAAAAPAPESRVIDAEVVAAGATQSAEPETTPAAGETIPPTAETKPEYTVTAEQQAELINSLREAGSKDDLAQAWKLVKKAYKAAGVDMPNDVETVYIDCMSQVERDLNK